MKNLTLSNLAGACGGILYNYSPRLEKEVSGVVLDSRKVKENFLFIATKGERTDGHDFIAQVMEQGAAGVVCERKPAGIQCPCILVEDSFKALKSIAAFYRRQLAVKVVGITGSVGKTSTKELIASVLSMKYNVLKTDGNYNNEVGLPLTVLSLREEHEVAVLEMGISDFGEMHRLSEIARPDICVITNIGQCHLENLKTREGILKAKTEIFDFMGPDGYVCLNGDDDMLRTVEAVKGRKPVFFGLSKENQVYADQVADKGLFGSSAAIHIGASEFTVDIPLPGGHMIYNALAAACVGSLLQLTAEETGRGIREVKPVRGRSHIIRSEGLVIIDDCYNANPVSMCAALDLLAGAITRKAAVLGDMFELGADTAKLHAKVGSYAAEKGIDLILCVGEQSKYMYEAAMEAAERLGREQKDIYYFENKTKCLLQLPGLLEKGDSILVKASHGMGFGDVVKALSDLE